MEKLEQIKNHPVYQQVLNDSFGGIMYDADNQGKYDTAEIIALWDSLNASEKELAGGIMEGAFGFLKGSEV